MVVSKVIVPGVSPCCTPNPQADILPDGSIIMDADCVNDGDSLTCPTDKEQVIFVFGTDWWRAHGGSETKNAYIKAWCRACCKYILIDTWSYRG